MVKLMFSQLRSFLVLPSAVTASLLAATLLAFSPTTPAVALEPTGSKDLTVSVQGVYDDDPSAASFGVTPMSMQIRICGDDCDENDPLDYADGAIDNVTGEVFFDDLPVYPEARYEFVIDYLNSEDATHGYARSVGDTGGCSDIGVCWSSDYDFAIEDISTAESSVTVPRHYVAAGAVKMSGRVMYLVDGSEMSGAVLTGHSGITIDGVQYGRSVIIEAGETGDYEFSGLSVGANAQVGFDAEYQPAEYANPDLYESTYEGGFKVREGRSVYRVNVYVPEPEFIDDGESGSGNGTGSWSAVVEQDGVPIDFCADVYIRSEDNGYSNQDSSCSGEFSMASLPNGTYVVFIDGYSSGGAADTFVIDDLNQVVDSGPIEFEAFPDPDSSVSFEALNDDGESIAGEISGAWLEPISVDGISQDIIDAYGLGSENFLGERFGDSNWWVDDSGVVTIDNVSPGTYRLEVTVGSDYSEENLDYSWEQPRGVEVVIEAGNTELDPVISNRIDASGDELLIKVKDSETRIGVEGVNCWVSAYPSDTESTTNHRLTAVTDAAGIATFSSVLRGQTYDVTCDSWGDQFGRSVKRKAISIAAGVNKFAMSIDFLYPDATVSGRVVDSDGDPVEGIRVAAEFAFHYPDCRCGDGFGIVDYTDENGEYFLDDVLSGSSGAIRAYDGSRTFADWGVSLDNVEPGAQTMSDIVMKPGKPVAGTVVDGDGDPLSAEISLESTSGSFYTWGNSDDTGAIAFARSIPVGTYIVRASTGDSWALGGHAWGWVDENGSITVSQTDAQEFTVSEADAQLGLGEITIGVGASISGTGSFVDAEGEPLELWNYYAMAELYVERNGEWDVTASEMWGSRYGDISSWSGSEYSITGLPAGDYKVCFRDIYSTGARYEPICNGGVSEVDQAPVISVGEGQDVEGVDAVLKFAPPEVAPPLVDFDELDEDLAGGIAIRKNAAGKPAIKLDADQAGRWVAVQHRVEGSSRAADRAAIVQWIAVDANGYVALPVSPKKVKKAVTFVALNDNSDPLGWIQTKLANPGRVSQPTISGTLTTGNTVTATSGTWSNDSDTTSAWYACSKKPKTGAALSKKWKCSVVSSNRQTLELADSVRRKYLVYGVTATNAFGSAKYFVATKSAVR